MANKRYQLLAGVLLLLLVANPLMAMPRFLVKSITRNLRAEIRVNDIPVATIDPVDSGPLVIPVNQYLLKGINTLTVVQSKGQAVRASDADQAASLAITIAVYDTNETALGTDKLPMAELKWMGPALAAPETLSAQFSAPANTPSFAWQQAVKFESIDPQTRLQVLEELHQLYALLVAGDFADFVNEQRLKLHEVANVAYGMPDGTLQAQMLAALTSSSKPPFVLSPFASEGINLRLVAGGRMIECRQRDGRHVFEYRKPGTDQSFFVPTMVGNLDGRWQVLR